MNKKLLLFCVASGLLCAATSTSQINSQFSATSEVAASGTNVWTPTSVSSLSVDNANGYGLLSNFNGSAYTSTDCRMIYVGSSLFFGGSGDKYILSKEINTNSGSNTITGSNNLIVKLRIGSNDYLVNAEGATGYSNTKSAISRYAIPGKNAVVCLSRIKEMYFNSSYFPINTSTAVARIQYMHAPTSSSSLNTFNIDFVQSYLDSTSVFEAIGDRVGSYNKANIYSTFNVDFNASTYLPGFTASPTSFTLSNDNEFAILQTNASTPSLAYLQYQPSGSALFGGFLWNFQKSNAILVKINKQQALPSTTTYQVKLTLTVPDVVGKLTSYEYATPLSGEAYTSAVIQKNVNHTNDYYVRIDLSSMTCATAGAPSISTLQSQNCCIATKLQFLVTGGLSSGDLIGVDYLDTYPSKIDVDNYVNGLSGVQDITTIKNHLSLSKISILVSNGMLKIEGLIEPQFVRVYNMMGLEVFSKIVRDGESFTIAPGIYMVKINNEIFKIRL